MWRILKALRNVTLLVFQCHCLSPPSSGRIVQSCFLRWDCFFVRGGGLWAESMLETCGSAGSHLALACSTHMLHTGNVCSKQRESTTAAALQPPPQTAPCQTFSSNKPSSLSLAKCFLPFSAFHPVLYQGPSLLKCFQHIMKLLNILIVSWNICPAERGTNHSRVFLSSVSTISDKY